MTGNCPFHRNRRTPAAAPRSPKSTTAKETEVTAPTVAVKARKKVVLGPVALVAAGLGVAVVPAPTADLDVAGVTYRPLEPATLGIDLVAAHLGDAAPPAVERALVVLRGLTP